MDTIKCLYLIAGPNGAGKTTASFTILPDVLGIDEFVNADIIAYGLSPLNPERKAIQAGRMMLERIEELIQKEVSFALETTLATKTYAKLIKKVQDQGYEVVLLYFWLKSAEHAKSRVATRVLEGGHNIPSAVIERRYLAGIRNLFNIYSDICNRVLVYDNTDGDPEFIFGIENGLIDVVDEERYCKMKVL